MSVIACNHEIKFTCENSKDSDLVVLRSYETFIEAQAATDFLLDNKFPQDNARIVAHGVAVKQASGDRIPWPKAALGGMTTGAIVGMFSGWAVGQFAVSAPVSWISILSCSVVVAAFISGVFSLLVNSQRKLGAELGSCISVKQFNVVIPQDSKMEAEKILARRF